MATRTTANWRAHTNVLDTILDLFGGWEDAIVELVKNSIDADASEVRILCTQGRHPEGHEAFLSVTDNGGGMSPDEVAGKYMVLGRDKRGEDGDVSPGGRNYLGKRGTGKVASTLVANRITVESVQDGVRTIITYNAQTIRDASTGKDVELDVAERVGLPNGTVVTLSALKNPMLFWNLATQASTVLLRDFAQRGDIRFLVNDVEFDPTQLATSADRFDEDVPGCGRVQGEIWIAKAPLKTPGLVVYHENQRVAEPSVFGVSKNAGQKEVKTAVSSVLGRVDVYPADGFTSASNWRLSESYRALEAWLGDRIRLAVSKEAQEHLRDRVERWLRDARVRRYWLGLDDDEKAETREILLRRAQVAKDDRAETIIASLVARSMNSRNLAAVLSAVDDADDHTINTLAEILEGEDPWELRQVAVAATVVKERLRTLDRLEEVTGEAKFDEKEAHRILQEEPWIIADDFLSYRSNKTLRTTLKLLGKFLPSDEGSERPDFVFVLGDVASTEQGPNIAEAKYLFVELKGTSQPMGKSQQHQATDDAERFIRRMGGGFAYVWLLGAKFDDEEPAAKDLDQKGVYTYRAITYESLIAVARRRVTYLNGAKAMRAEVLTRKVRALEAAELAAITDGNGKESKGKDTPLPVANEAAPAVES